MEPVIIGASCGDINGVGLEILLKILAANKTGKNCTMILYANNKVAAYHKNIIPDMNVQFNVIRKPHEGKKDAINIINCWDDNVSIDLGKPSKIAGECAALSLNRAMEDLKDGSIDALVTAPINKKSMEMANFGFPGHTEYLTHAMGANHSLMLMISDNLKLGLVTNHLPIKDVAKAITKELVLTKIGLMAETLKIDFGYDRATIAVLGLNPHAGDNGAIGKEELEIIRPAIEEAKNQGILAFGPYPADGFFGSGQMTKFDGILAMYHDQGLVAFKALSFGAGVNYTGGLPVIRTSPDHGTAYDIVGSGQADESSMMRAIYAAIEIVEHRKNYLDMTEDKMAVTEKQILESVTGDDEYIEEVPEE